MGKGRLEAFSDGVIAIIITIMVLEIKAPHGTEPSALRPLVPVLLSYVLSFANVGIYWNNHHHMLHATRKINGQVLWANLHLLFWLSLIPVVTAWVGERPEAPFPTSLYAVVLFLAAVAYIMLQSAIVRCNGERSALAAAVGADRKGKVSQIIYLAAIGLAWVRPWIAQALFVVVALIWIVPDPRIEKRSAEASNTTER